MQRNAQRARSAALLSSPSLWVVIAALTYTAALCFVNTRIMGVSNTHIAVADGAIVLAALALAFRSTHRVLWIVLLALSVNFLLIALLSEEFGLKAVRDPLVLIAFTALGQAFGGARAASRAFIVASVIVVPLALIELLAPQLYTQFFDVFRFYQGRGMISAEQAQYQASSFFVSGARDDGRFLTSFFGSHRASSVFLEPVSMGNFGALAAAFALSLGRERWRTALALGGAAAFCIIAADARFAAAVVGLFLLARLVPTRWAPLVLAPMPMIAVAIIITISLFVSEAGDTFLSRLALSGQRVTELDFGALLGLDPMRLGTVDSGYTYALASLGLPVCLGLWVAFLAVPTHTPEAARYKLMLGIYACALLCISGSSLFALKTAALGWFAFGAMAAQAKPATARAAPARRATRAVPA